MLFRLFVVVAGAKNSLLVALVNLPHISKGTQRTELKSSFLFFASDHQLCETRNNVGLKFRASTYAWILEAQTNFELSR